MKLVIDANILFAALIRNSETRRLLLLRRYALYAPEQILQEIQKYSKTLQQKTNLSQQEIEHLLQNIVTLADITIVQFQQLKPHRKEAERISPDPNDAAYFACALYKDCGIWSNDKRLQQQHKIRIITTEELTKE